MKGRRPRRIVRGGHVSFTSCELYNPNYGNGIGESKSLSKEGATYTPLAIKEQHTVCNSYGLAFLTRICGPSIEARLRRLPGGGRRRVDGGVWRRT